MVLSIRLLTNNDLAKVRKEWNDFILNYSDNPFLLNEFVQEFIKLGYTKPWNPLVFIGYDDKVIGIMPLAVESYTKINVVKFLLKPYYSPDFVIIDSYREEVLNHLIKILFKNINCHLIDITVPSESKNMNSLIKNCKIEKKNFKVCTDVELGHCVLPVRCSWKSFENELGGNFRRKIRKIEQKMRKAGGYEVTNTKQINSFVIKDIFQIEKRSWKEDYRRKKGIKADPELIKILEVMKSLNEIPDIEFKIWFLRINGQTASYVITLRFKNAGYILKTSFDEAYSVFYPGIYTINVAVKDFFESGLVDRIDYLTNLPFMETWKPEIHLRKRIIIAKNKLYYPLVQTLFSRSISRVISKFTIFKMNYM